MQVHPTASITAALEDVEREGGGAKGGRDTENRLSVLIVSVGDQGVWDVIVR